MARSAKELAAWAATPWPRLGLRSEAELAAAVGEFRAALGAGSREFWLGRKTGLLTLLNENWLKPAPPEWKRALGQQLNQLKREAEARAERQQAAAQAEAVAQRLRAERVDITLPGRSAQAAPAHPILQVRDEIVDIFLRLGYTVADGPEIETTYYNFEALNIPEGHPAREEQDTLYLGPDLERHVLRTHTSPVQIRTMEKQAPPLRVIVPGKVYRRDAPDATHSPNFHQIEGLAVDTDLHWGDLKGTLEHFARALFGTTVRTRLRPSYFQFTEPSAELDVSCIFCQGRGCRTCKHSGWIELLGCGMVDPAVFGFVNYDPERVSGFAFGLGIDRVAMIRYGVDDLQRFYSGDLRFLEQFR
ncbi:MAG TPA: phenylalanine--tRNA ligase subunit alpha [Terriglobales bacterium]|nr:phenylalanine--tRNA ligase subunit alpha [Terriglobales bacterium]